MEHNAYHLLRAICCSIFKELLSFYNRQSNCKHLVLMFDAQEHSKSCISKQYVRFLCFRGRIRHPLEGDELNAIFQEGFMAVIGLKEMLLIAPQIGPGTPPHHVSTLIITLNREKKISGSEAKQTWKDNLQKRKDNLVSQLLCHISTKHGTTYAACYWYQPFLLNQPKLFPAKS